MRSEANRAWMSIDSTNLTTTWWITRNDGKMTILNVNCLRAENSLRWHYRIHLNTDGSLMVFVQIFLNRNQKLYTYFRRGISSTKRNIDHLIVSIVPWSRGWWKIQIWTPLFAPPSQRSPWTRPFVAFFFWTFCVICSPFWTQTTIKRLIRNSRFQFPSLGFHQKIEECETVMFEHILNIVLPVLF